MNGTFVLLQLLKLDFLKLVNIFVFLARICLVDGLLYTYIGTVTWGVQPRILVLGLNNLTN